MNAPNTAQHLMPAVNQRPVPPALLDALKAAFGDRCSTTPAVSTVKYRSAWIG
jgi:D-lactate dehydrogenase (cytochrome)